MTAATVTSPAARERALQGASTIGVLPLSITMLMDLPGGHGRNMGAAGIGIGSGTASGSLRSGWLPQWVPSRSRWWRSPLRPSSGSSRRLRMARAREIADRRSIRGHFRVGAILPRRESKAFYFFRLA